MGKMPALMKYSSGTRVLVSKDTVSSHLADEIVILDLKSGVYHGLDGVGARIWETLGEATPIHEIRDTLLAEYDVSADRCEEDLASLIGTLQSHGLVQISS
jgi:hypothetical protein